MSPNHHFEILQNVTQEEIRHLFAKIADRMLWIKFPSQSRSFFITDDDEVAEQFKRDTDLGASVKSLSTQEVLKIRQSLSGVIQSYGDISLWEHWSS